MRVVLVVLVGVAALFAGGIALGARQGRDAADRSWVNELGDALLGQAEPVPAADLSGACVGERALVVAGPPCAVRVASSGDPVRELELRLAAGTASLRLIQDDQVTVRVDLPDGDDGETSFTVFDAGGILTVQCPPPGCALEF